MLTVTKVRNQRAETGKNERCKQRRANRKAQARSEAEARQKLFDALPEDQKLLRRASKLARKAARP